MEFVMGADVSSLQAMEDHGAKYYDFNGMEGDALAILKNHGINYIRLRLWNRPTTSFEEGDYCDLAHTVVMAKRVKKMGLGLLLDFHYSDSWADWKAQKIPAEWEGQDAEALEGSVYRYTRDVLEMLYRENACPDMVQIGNEIGNGLLWDYGRMEHPKQLAAFLNAGIRAVREADTGGRKVKIMLHIESGGEKEKTEGFFQMLEDCGVREYDVIGLSYYPYWAGVYEKLLANMRNVEKVFSKPVVLAETAFPYTDESHDAMPNMVSSELTRREMGIEASEQNQRKVMDEIIQLVRGEKNGGGIFYWEPVWYCMDGVGAEKGAGNEWENQALFDCEGKALDGLHAFEQ